MTRIAILLIAVACGGGPKKPATTGTGSGGPAVYGKKIQIGWGFQKASASTDVFLQTTDETGKQVSYPLGTYPGECKTITPFPTMKAAAGVACTGGVELHAVVQDEDIIILKLPGGTTDPMAREEIKRVTAPGGTAIVTGT